jgi:rhodanese-related sulfurtransferase
MMNLEHNEGLNAEHSLRRPAQLYDTDDQTDQSRRLGSWVSRVLFMDFLLVETVRLQPLVFFALSVSALIAMLLWKRRRDLRHQLESHTISAETLHDLLMTAEKPKVLDLRVPLDFLAHAETIPGARRIAPNEIIANPNILPKEVEYVLYCTGSSDASNRTVLRTALKLGFPNVKMLAGGIEAWKQKGFPVEAYLLPFHLDSFKLERFKKIVASK